MSKLGKEPVCERENGKTETTSPVSLLFDRCEVQPREEGVEDDGKCDEDEMSIFMSKIVIR